MSAEKSIIGKTETALDDIIDLWKRRKPVCVLVLIVVFLPTAFTLYQQAIAVPRLKSKATALDTEMQKAERERDKAQIRLAPFLAAANQSFSNAPPDKRLDLLFIKMDDMLTKVQTATDKLTYKRSIPSKIRQALIADLRVAPPPQKVLVIYPSGDEEARLFALEIEAALIESKMKVESTWWRGSPVPSGISVLSKSKISNPSAFCISRALANAGIRSEYMRGTLIPNEDLQIIVGPKP